MALMASMAFGIGPSQIMAYALVLLLAGFIGWLVLTMCSPRLGWLLTVSYALSIFGFSVPWISVHDERLLSLSASLQISFLVFLCWAISFAAAIYLYRRRALWVLIGVLPVIWWSVWYVVL